MIIKNPAWLMPRISMQWMQSHLSPDELHLLTAAASENADTQHNIETLQAFVPVSLLQKLNAYADKVDQNSKQCHENLVEKISSFCNGAL